MFNEPTQGIGDGAVVILGRRHASDYETEFDFIQCIGRHIGTRDNTIEIIDEVDFVNSLYPWFEPRTAPLRPADIDRLLQQKPVAEQVAQMKLQYLIWVDGRAGGGGAPQRQTSGQSYMPAVVVPIPIIAPVQGTACDGLGEQLLEFLSSEY